MCVCIVFSIIEHVYWYSRVTLSSMFVGKSSYVSFPRSSFLCIHIVIFFFKSEMSDLLLGDLGHCLFHHYIHCWCDFTSYFDLSWSSFISICSLFRRHPCHCFWFISFILPPCSFLTLTYSRFATLFTLFLHILLSVRFASFISSSIYSHWAPLGLWLTSFYAHFAFIHEGLGFDHRVFGPSFPSFLLP